MKVRVWFFSMMLLVSLWALGQAHARVKGSARRPGTRVGSLSRVHAGIKKFVLTVKEGVVELNGVRFPVLTLNGTVPGPEIRVKEGDRVKIRLVNRSRAGQTLIFQFQDLDVPFAMTGPGQSQKPVGPGEEFTYELIARPSGTYLYHCGVHPTAHLDRGLYGAMIIEAPDEPKAGRELVYILDEWNSKAARGKSAHEMGHPRTAGGYDIVTANGKMIRDHVLLVLQGEAKKGETLRVRLANVGRFPHTLSFPRGFTVTHEDGHRLPEPRKESSLTLYPGKRYDLSLTATESDQISFAHAVEMPKPFRPLGNEEPIGEHPWMTTGAGSDSIPFPSPALVLELDTNYYRVKQNHHPEGKK